MAQDGVEALQQCSEIPEFLTLRKIAQQNTKNRQKHLGEDSPVSFKFENKGQRQFLIYRNTPLAGVVFNLENDHISVQDLEEKEMFMLTLTMNDDGECRFKIDGNGEFKRWQVMRKALEELFFPTQPS